MHLHLFSVIYWQSQFSAILSLCSFIFRQGGDVNGLHNNRKTTGSSYDLSHFERILTIQKTEKSRSRNLRDFFVVLLDYITIHKTRGLPQINDTPHSIKCQYIFHYLIRLLPFISAGISSPRSSLKHRFNSPSMVFTPGWTCQPF